MIITNTVHPSTEADRPPILRRHDDVCHIYFAYSLLGGDWFSMNIFQKNCPECTAVNSAEAISCDCGYVFDPDALASADPTKYAEEQDRLYRDYLAARVAQAEAELTVARGLANADPENKHKASSRLLAEQALNALKAEVKQLSASIPSTPSAESTPVAKRQISQASKPAPAKSPAPRVDPVPVTPTPTRNATPVTATSPKVPAPSTAVEAKVQAAPPAQPAARNPVAVPEIRRQPESTPANAATSQTRLPRSPIAPPPINGKRRQTNPAITAKPGESFKQLQTQKAETIARSKPVTPATPQPRTTVNAASQPASQECPNCTAKVAATATRCSCGYLLSRPGEEVPALSLDAGALAILTEGISFNSSNRRR